MHIISVLVVFLLAICRTNAITLSDTSGLINITDKSALFKSLGKVEHQLGSLEEGISHLRKIDEEKNSRLSRYASGKLSTMWPILRRLITAIHLLPDTSDSYMLGTLRADAVGFIHGLSRTLKQITTHIGIHSGAHKQMDGAVGCIGSRLHRVSSNIDGLMESLLNLIPSTYTGKSTHDDFAHVFAYITGKMDAIADSLDHTNGATSTSNIQSELGAFHAAIQVIANRLLNIARCGVKMHLDEPNVKYLEQLLNLSSNSHHGMPASACSSCGVLDKLLSLKPSLKTDIKGATFACERPIAASLSLKAEDLDRQAETLLALRDRLRFVVMPHVTGKIPEKQLLGTVEVNNAIRSLINRLRFDIDFAISKTRKAALESISGRPGFPRFADHEMLAKRFQQLNNIVSKSTRDDRFVIDITAIDQKLQKLNTLMHRHRNLLHHTKVEHLHALRYQAQCLYRYALPLLRGIQQYEVLRSTLLV